MIDPQRYFECKEMIFLRPPIAHMLLGRRNQFLYSLYALACSVDPNKLHAM
jgi:hypothetical protein